MRNNFAINGVEEEDFRPGGSATIGRVDCDFGKHLVKRSKIAGAIVPFSPRSDSPLMDRYHRREDPVLQ